jgi:hypothetical protein
MTLAVLSPFRIDVERSVQSIVNPSRALIEGNLIGLRGVFRCIFAPLAPRELPLDLKRLEVQYSRTARYRATPGGEGAD